MSIAKIGAAAASSAARAMHNVHPQTRPQIRQAEQLSPVRQGEMARAQKAAKLVINEALRKTSNIGALIGKIIELRNAQTIPPQEMPVTVEGARTIDDFELKDATAEEKADFEFALAYLQQADAEGNPVSPTAVELLAQLPEGQEIWFDQTQSSGYHTGMQVIRWNSEHGTQAANEAIQSPALALIHEVDHAVNGGPLTPTNDAYDNTEEFRVITGSERQIAIDLGEPIRFDHRGTRVPVDTPATHTEVDYSDPEAVVEILNGQ